jgi:phospholipase C
MGDRDVRIIRLRSARLLPVALAALLAGCGAPMTTGARGTVPAFDHIFVIVMENRSFGSIIGSSQAPYINGLAGQFGLATNYTAVSHPSLPNYLALTGGSTFGVITDCTTCFQNHPNIAVDRVEASGRSWKSYQEDYPGGCRLSNAGEYAQKHNPFIYYDIRTRPAECAKIVPYTELAADLGSAATTPDYVWITPNLIDDMHDGTIAQGDAWLRQNVPTILGSAAWTSQRSLLFITWDEDDGSQSNQVATLVISRSTPAGFRSGVAYTHYSLLKTIEASWGLSPLTANDSAASAMSDFFP